MSSLRTVWITALVVGGALPGGLAAAEAPLVVPGFSGDPLGAPPPIWQFAGLAHQTKPRTQFQIVEDEGTHVLQVASDHSYGNLALMGRRNLSLRTRLAWRWKLDVPNLSANLRTRAGDDAPVKVCLAFDYDSGGLSFGERTELQIARMNYPIPVPIATLCYVWDHQLPAGTALANAFTDRIRYIVLESGEARLHSWVTQERNIMEDFWKTFGPEFQAKAPDDLPELIGVLVGGDADNTGEVTSAEVGDIRLED